MGVRILFLVLLGLCLGGCRVAERAEVEGIQAGWSVVGPRYVAYLKADPALAARPDILADRVKTADDLTAAIATLVKKVRG